MGEKVLQQGLRRTEGGETARKEGNQVQTMVSTMPPPLSTSKRRKGAALVVEGSQLEGV